MKTERLEELKQLASRVLARRAVACKQWRWMRGMLASRSRVVRIKLDNIIEVWAPGDWIEELPNNALPDLRDPATLGCLLAIVREAYHAPDAYLMGSVTKQWVVHHFAEPEGYWKSLTKWQSTEAAALVAALEAAS